MLKVHVHTTKLFWPATCHHELATSVGHACFYVAIRFKIQFYACSLHNGLLIIHEHSVLTSAAVRVRTAGHIACKA